MRRGGQLCCVPGAFSKSMIEDRFERGENGAVVTSNMLAYLYHCRSDPAPRLNISAELNRELKVLLSVGLFLFGRYSWREYSCSHDGVIVGAGEGAPH